MISNRSKIFTPFTPCSFKGLIGFKITHRAPPRSETWVRKTGVSDTRIGFLSITS